MMTWIDASVPLLAWLAGCASVIRYWQLVDEACRDDLQPDPVLMAQLQQQPEQLATAPTRGRAGSPLPA